MTDLIQFIENSPLLTTVIGGAILSLVLWVFSFIKKSNTSASDIEDSQSDFIDLNRKWISEKRKLISRKAYEYNLKYIKDENSFFTDPETLPLLTKKEWIPEIPLMIDSVHSELTDEVPPSVIPRIDILPYSNKNSRFTEYHEAVKSLIKPPLFTNNRHYRLQKIKFNQDSVKLHISREANSYFNKIDYGKTAELEFTAAIKSANKVQSPGSSTSLLKLPSKSSQKYRNQILSILSKEDDFRSTVILGGVSTLTLIYTKEGSFRFLMHIRSANQGYAESTRHVVPAGEFQPLSKGNNFKSDTRILYNILREYAEEIEGLTEFTGENDQRYDYESSEVFKKYFAELGAGNVKVYYLGFGLDPLSLQGEHLTCAVFKEESFNKLFGEKVSYGNDEGQIITDSNVWGLTFNTENIEDQYMGNILSAGEAILRLTEKHLPFFKKEITR